MTAADQADREKKLDDPNRWFLRSSAVLANRPNLASWSATNEGRGREERVPGVGVGRLAAWEMFCMVRGWFEWMLLLWRWSY